MTTAVRIVRNLKRRIQLMACNWRITKFRFLEGSVLQNLEIESGTKFNVPVRCGGLGSLLIGSGNNFGYLPAPRIGTGEILLQPRTKKARIVIGKGNSFNNNVSIVATEEITIGDGCLIGDLVSIYDCDFHELDPAFRNRSVGPIRPVTIGNNVWLSSRVMILKGVTIGDNSVVGAMSLVTKSIPANCIAAGNPAKVLRSNE